VSTCNAILYSRCAYKTILLYNKVAIQHSFNILLTEQSKRSETNLGRALGGQPIKMGYMLKITTESIGNNRGSVDRIGKEGNHLHSNRKSSDFRFGREISMSSF
jgi:hypothetical protein